MIIVLAILIPVVLTQTKNEADGDAQENALDNNLI